MFKPAFYRDIHDIQHFYRSYAGRLCRRRLAHAINHLWRPPLPTEKIVGIGYTQPYLSDMLNKTAVFSLMPADMGASPWLNAAGQHIGLMAMEESLPLADNSIDRLLLVHSLEMSENRRQYLRELWRVLAPEGLMLLVVPSRTGFWAHGEHTPFGQGTPFTMSQLQFLLQDHLFTPLKTSHALYFLPCNRRFFLRLSIVVEKFYEKLFPSLAGVHLVLCQKRVYANIYTAGKKKQPNMQAVDSYSSTMDKP
ncbi:MAG: methyltransferase domain-containing protein [Alphaproteobacteria bacterium]